MGRLAGRTKSRTIFAFFWSHSKFKFASQRITFFIFLLSDELRGGEGREDVDVRWQKRKVRSLFLRGYNFITFSKLLMLSLFSTSSDYSDAGGEADWKINGFVTSTEASRMWDRQKRLVEREREREDWEHSTGVGTIVIRRTREGGRENKKERQERQGGSGMVCWLVAIVGRFQNFVLTPNCLF